jgi:hypothetical protein
VSDEGKIMREDKAIGSELPFNIPVKNAWLKMN